MLRELEMQQSAASGSRCLDDDIETTPLLSTQPKFRWSIVWVLVTLMAIVTATSELTWPFINQMIVDIGAAPDQKSVGFYSGLIETVASFFGFATIFPGSVVADQWGRKTVMYGALLGTTIGQMFFGVSSSLMGLIVCKSIGYALGPQLAWSSTVTILGDLSDEGHRGAAFSAVNASYRLGQLISPAFAALLAHPAARYPAFRSNFWITHPYALPCFAGAALSITGVYIAAWCLPETAPGNTVPKGDDLTENGYSAVGPIKDLGSSRHTVLVIQDETAPPEMIPATMEPVIRLASGQNQVERYDTHIMQLLISSGLMYFIAISMFTIFPLWAFTPISSGGLGASEAAIGGYISGRALIHFLGLIPFAYWERRLGVHRLYAYSLSIASFGPTLLLPMISLLAKTPNVNSIWINLAMLAYFVAGSLTNYCTTCMVMMINEAAPSAQALSRLVGVSQSAIALGQCIAPIITLSIFEFSIKSEILNGNTIWVFMFVVSLAASLHSFTLKMPVPTK